MMKKNKEMITFVGGNTDNFKKDLFKALEGKTFEDVYQLQDCLEEFAKNMIKDYIYFESKTISKDPVMSVAESILEKHKEAFIELSK